MGRQLDILALEPFFGGIRRVMLETLVRYSRHRWTLLKLPPRRIERRLTAAAVWFSEQLSRHWVGNTDLLFTSEALNLADLYRMMPQLLHKPAVVYFHDNQLPAVDARQQSGMDLINLNTAAAATEIWFNSLHHLRTFLARATALINRHPELQGLNPMPELTRKAQIMFPPIDSSYVHEACARKIARERRTIFVDTRDADNQLLSAAIFTVRRRGENCQVITVGPTEGLPSDFERITIPENDPAAQAQAMCRAGVFLSTRANANCDHHAIRALGAGCWPLFPQTGVYRELIPDMLHTMCLYEKNASALASRIQDVFLVERPGGYEAELDEILKRYDPVPACKIMDERLDEIVAQRPASGDV
jgi:hypothetical protein